MLDGRVAAKKLQERLRERIGALSQQGITPAIAPILVGEDSAAVVYYRSKTRLARKLGIRFAGIELPEETDQQELVDTIRRLNIDPQVDGIFVELPLPSHISREEIARAISADKDIDGINPLSMGLLLVDGAGTTGYRELNERGGLLLPATPRAVMELLLGAGVDLAGKEAVVVGRSLAVGRPLSFLLLTEGATVTICHSKTRSIKTITRRGDIVCVAIGRPRFLTADMVKKGAVVIDIGINVTPDGIVGDVDYEAVAAKASLITPVPGGVGPMTTTMIMANVVKCAARRA